MKILFEKKKFKNFEPSRVNSSDGLIGLGVLKKFWKLTTEMDAYSGPYSNNWSQRLLSQFSDSCT